MPLFKVERPSPRQPADPVDEYAIPDHLAGLYAQAPGLTAEQKVDYYKNPPRETTLHRELPGSGDDLERLADVPLELVEHRHKLRHAQAKYENAKNAAAIKAMAGRCDLCGREEWPAAQLAQVDTGTRTLRLCRGSCADVVSLEVNRRRWHARLTELLDTDTASTDAPVLR